MLIKKERLSLDEIKRFGKEILSQIEVHSIDGQRVGISTVVSHATLTQYSGIC